MAERSLLAYGNALATVGKGKAELAGVTTALTQISAKGKVTAEEINQIAERVPQIRVAMQAAFGTANTEALQKMGLTAKQFIQGVNDELLKLPRVTGGAQNAFENLEDTTRKAFIAIGNNILPTLLPMVERVTRGLTDMTAKFAALSPEVRRTILVIGGLTALAGPTILFLGQFKAAAVALGVSMPAVAGAIRAVITLLTGPWGVAIAAAITAISLLKTAWDNDLGGMRTTIENWFGYVAPLMQEGWKGIVEGAQVWWAGLKEAWGNLWDSMANNFGGFIKWVLEKLAQLPAALGLDIEKLQRMIELWSVGRAGQMAIDTGPVGPDPTRPAPPVAPPWKPTPEDKKKKLTPLEEEMLALQGRLNAAWNTGTAILKGYTPEVSRLMGEMRHAAATGAGQALIIQVAGAEKVAEGQVAAAQKVVTGFEEIRRELIAGTEELHRLSMAGRATGEAGQAATLAWEKLGLQIEQLEPAERKLVNRLAHQNTVLKIQRGELALVKQANEAWEQSHLDISAALRRGTQALSVFRDGSQEALYTWQTFGQSFKNLLPDAQENIRALMKVDQTLATLQTLAQGTKDIFFNAFTSIQDGFGNFFSSIYQGFKNMLVQMAAEYLSSQIQQVFLNAVGGYFTGGKKAGKGGAGLGMGGGGLAGAINAYVSPGLLTVPGRQHGGSIMGGKPYLVGERGPELIMPRRSGNVIPNHQLAGAGGHTFNITVNGQMDERTMRNLKAQMVDALNEADRQRRRNG
jgi:tape measure domain-containing protein